MAKRLAPNLFTCESSGWARMSRGENCLPRCSPTTFVLHSKAMTCWRPMNCLTTWTWGNWRAGMWAMKLQTYPALPISGIWGVSIRQWCWIAVIQPLHWITLEACVKFFIWIVFESIFWIFIDLGKKILMKKRFLLSMGIFLLALIAITISFSRR